MVPDGREDFWDYSKCLWYKLNLTYAEQGGRQEDVDLGPFCQVHYGLLLQPYKILLMVVTAIRTMLKAWAELQNVSDMADISV